MYGGLATLCLLALCQIVVSGKAPKTYQKKWNLNGKIHKTFAADLVKAHNEVRKKETEAKPPLQDLVWDKKLSKKAQLWAERCVFEHSHEKGVGENIAARGVIPADKPDLMDDKLALKEMLNSVTDPEFKMGWYDEKAFFKYPTGCQGGKMCGHYTQVVWADTKAVGCGMAQCKNVACGPNSCNNGLLVVCQYTPPGNMIMNGVKEAPYKIA